MPTYPNINLVAPTLGGDAGQWAPKTIAPSNVDMDKLCSRIRYDRGCWEWTGAKNKQGYGVFRMRDGRTALVHRAMYEIEIGGLEKWHLDHLCRNPACCNPAHLDPVTQQENSRRGTAGDYLKARTHCPKGHAYTAENTRYKPGSPSRNCRQCGRDYEARKRRGQV